MCQSTTAGPVVAAAPPIHQPGTCPCCGQDNLSYGDSGLQELSYYYKWRCKACNARGTEWYDLVFSEHHVKSSGQAAQPE